MTGTRLGIGTLVAAIVVLGSSPAVAQQATPEQRIERLERQLRQV